MGDLYRLVYASKANIEQSDVGVNLEIGRILSKSKRNNAKLSIGGILYYGDGHFLQVLEGPEAAVQALYLRICRDSRHQYAMVLDEHSINRRLFGEWSMHFIPNQSDVRNLLKHYGLQSFSPFQFSPEITKALVMHFSRAGSIDKGKSNFIVKGVNRVLHRLHLV